MNSFERLVDLKQFRVTEDELAAAGPYPIKWFNHEEDPALTILRIMRNPAHFHFTCKHLLGIDLNIFQLVVLNEMWNHPFPMLIATRGGSKTWMLALYSVLRAVFLPGTKVVATGMGFRQAKQILGYAFDFWKKSPVLQSLYADHPDSGPHPGNDRWVLRLGDSTITGLPIGDGSSIRGERANVVIGDEFASISREIFETVVAGFGVVSLSPTEQVRNKARIEVLKELNAWNEELEERERHSGLGNQLIISGTAFFAFNHFHFYWHRWKQILESRGDEKKLREAFQGNEVPDGLDWRDYAIIRIPIELLPDGFMEMTQIARSKATMHSGIFQQEFEACLHPDTDIITDCGLKAIQDIQVGDMVLTHKGRFRRVEQTMVRPSHGQIIEYRTLGCNVPTLVTEEHPFWIGNDDWVELDNLDSFTHLANLQNLSGKTSVDIREIDDNFRDASPGYIYATAGSARLSNEAINELRGFDGNLSEFGRRYGVGPSTIHTAKSQIDKPRKFQIPAVIGLDYDFGVIVGYYASEGSVGADGRCVNFAMDGHVTAPLTAYVKQLEDAISRVFGLSCWRYYGKSDNTLSLLISNRLVASLMKRICPGIAGTKSVDPEILWSNEEFLRGFIVGYWNGDGHLSSPYDRNVSSKSNSTSRDLTCQVRVALSYFGISSTFTSRQGSIQTIRGKEYNCSDHYVLVTSGINDDRLYSLVTNQPIDSRISHGIQKIRNENAGAILPLISKTSVPYDGPVYNLEVADDHSYSLLNATVHNCFSRDSNGFFKRSLVESCITKDPIQPFNSTDLVKFQAMLRGNPNCSYIYGIDPASEKDRLSIVILEVHPSHRRIVYCWTTTRQEFKQRLDDKLTGESDFYGFIAKKIRELMRYFPCELIALDSQGGGIGVIEALGDLSKLKSDERPIYRIADGHPLHDGVECESDDKSGLHIVEWVNFANSKYVSEANHGMRKDFEDKALLFPYCDPATLAIACEEDSIVGRKYDTQEDVVMEIEDLKDELSTITHTQTPTTLRDHWDTPDEKLPGQKKGRLRKDRYSSLLMANYAARRITRKEVAPPLLPYGGFIKHVTYSDDAKPDLGHGPDWWTKSVEGNFDDYGCV